MAANLALEQPDASAWLKITSSVGLIVSGDGELRRMLQRCAEVMVRELSFALARIWLLNRAQNVLEPQASAGLYGDPGGIHNRIPVGRFQIGRICETLKPQLTNTLTGDPLVQNQEWARREGVTAFAGYPLMVGRRPLGVLGVFSRRCLADDTLEYLGAVADIIAVGVERKEAERERRQEAEEASNEHSVNEQRPGNGEQQARDAARAKDEFLAILGHELRNPLAPIVTALHVMSLRGGADKFGRELAVINRQIEHMRRLVDDLLDLSRITRGRIQLRAQECELAPIVARAVETASPLLEQRRHRLVIDVPADGLKLEADPLRLAQVISNLLTNAARYTDPEGEISISARRISDQIEIEVKDNGSGVSPNLLPGIFEPFIQGERSIDRSLGGLGIGLSLVRNLVEAHGGTVEARSGGVGKGSEFIVRLPALSTGHSSEALSLRSRSIALRKKVGSPKRVLIVDDNEDAAEALSSALEDCGFVTQTALDGPTALQVAEEFRPEAAVLDIGLPVMDGYELARRIRKIEGIAHLTLVALTGYGQVHDRISSAEAGFDGHLLKPVDIGELVQQLTSGESAYLDSDSE